MRGYLSALVALTLTFSLAAGEKDKNAKPKVTPSERIEQLLLTLRNDRKEDKRSKAAEELGTLASSEYPEVVSGLIDALVRDDSTTVRKAVIRSLASIEPASHEVKDALDQAVKADKSWPVRQVARMALWRYKPKDEPQHIPGPQLRNTSKPSKNGKTPAATKPIKPEPVDPLKSMPLPAPVEPKVPVVPAPEMAPGPGLKLNLDVVPTKPTGEPARLIPAKPAGQ
jgi:hypothetical protein